jgi:hypothetical protein
MGYFVWPVQGGGGGGGTGDVVGPSSSIQNAPATYADTTGKLLQSLSYLKMLDFGGDRTRLQGDTVEIHPLVPDGQYLYFADRQLTLVEKNLYFENVTTGGTANWGAVWWQTHNYAEVGFSEREGLLGGNSVGAPKTYWVGTDIKFDANGDGTHNGRIFAEDSSGGIFRVDTAQLSVRDITGASEYFTVNQTATTFTGVPLLFDNSVGTSNIGWVSNNLSDVGSFDAGVNRRGPRNVYVGTGVFFGAGSQQILQAGTNRTRLQGEQWDMYSDSSGTYYMEHILNNGGLHLIQTNCGFRFNTVSGAGAPGVLIFANENGAANGPRCFNTTLTGTTTVISNPTVTVDTVAIISVKTGVNQGFHTFTPSAGSLTITSSNASDASEVVITLVQNG